MLEEKDSLVKRLKKFTVMGTAFLVLLAVLAALGQGGRWVYAKAQKVEAISSLPEWLERIEGKVDNNTENIDENGRMLKQIYDIVVANHRGIGQ